MKTESLSARLEAVTATLDAHGQSQLLHGLDHDDEAMVEGFVNQVESIDLHEIADLIATPGTATASDGDQTIEPAQVVARHPEGEEGFREAGEALIREGGVAAFTVAGGSPALPWRSALLG